METTTSFKGQGADQSDEVSSVVFCWLCRAFVSREEAWEWKIAWHTLTVSL